jgi:hypothetical protein
LFSHLVGLNAQVLHDDLFHPLGNITHRSNLVLFRLGGNRDVIAAMAALASSW